MRLQASIKSSLYFFWGGGLGSSIEHVNLVQLIILKYDAICHAPNIYVNPVTIMEIQA